MRHKLLDDPSRFSRPRGLWFLAVLLAAASAAPARCDDPATKRDAKQELATARELAERLGGGIVDPARGWGLTLGVDAHTARRLEAVLTIQLEGPKVGDRELAELCDHLRHVPGAKSLVLEKTSVSDKGLAAVARLTRLRSLQITAAPLTGDGLGKLARLDDLVILDLGRTKVTDEGLARLKGPKHLKELLLPGTPVTDKGLAVLGKLSELEELDLSETAVTNAGLAEVKGLKQLQGLNLSGTKITAGALKPLAELEQLRDLSLGGTAVTDADLAHLAGLKRLRRLMLAKTQVGNAGLKHLEGLQQLEWLSLSGSRVTEAGLKYVAQLPRLELIDYDRPQGFLWLPPATKIPFEKADVGWGGPRSTPDGKVRLVVTRATPVFLLARLYDTENKKYIGGPIYHDKLAWGKDEMTDWAFSPDGKLVVTGSGYREGGGRSGDKTSVGQIRVWEVATGDLVSTYSGVGYVKRLAFSKDSKKVLYDAEKHEVDGP
jgi:hypothetical protein